MQILPVGYFLQKYRIISQFWFKDNKDILNDKQDGSITFRKETPQNIQSFKNDLATEDWTDVYSQRNVDTAYENFNKKLQLYYDKNFPLITAKNKSKRNKMPWITKAILRSIHRRNKLYKIYLDNPTIFNSDKYKKYRNKLTSIIRTSRKMHYSEKLNSVKSIYIYIYIYIYILFIFDNLRLHYYLWDYWP